MIKNKIWKFKFLIHYNTLPIVSGTKRMMEFKNKFENMQQKEMEKIMFSLQEWNYVF